MPDTVHTYKGVQVTQDASGNTQIKKGKETFVSGAGDRKSRLDIPGSSVSNYGCFPQDDGSFSCGYVGS